MAVISESLARVLGNDVLGRHLRVGNVLARQDIEIVGVVADMSLGSLRSSAPPVIYRPPLQEGAYGYYPNLQISTRGDPLLLVEMVRGTIRDLGREYAHEITTLEDRLKRSAFTERLSATAAASVAALAVILAFVGLYSLLAYAVARRSREIGIRLAVGAAPGALLWMMVRESMLLMAMGVGFGLPAAVAAARGLRTLLFGVGESDPTTLVAASTFLLVLGLAAGLIPARRAARVDPALTLRSE